MTPPPTLPVKSSDNLRPAPFYRFSLSPISFLALPFFVSFTARTSPFFLRVPLLFLEVFPLFFLVPTGSVIPWARFDFVFWILIRAQMESPKSRGPSLLDLPPPISCACSLDPFQSSSLIQDFLILLLLSSIAPLFTKQSSPPFLSPLLVHHYSPKFIYICPLVVVDFAPFVSVKPPLFRPFGLDFGSFLFFRLLSVYFLPTPGSFRSPFFLFIRLFL